MLLGHLSLDAFVYAPVLSNKWEVVLFIKELE
jgi:hypothetical protein